MDAHPAVTGPAATGRMGIATVRRILVLGAGLVFGAAAAVQQAAFAERLPVLVVADLLAGWSFLVAGVIAWQHRPANRVGPLLVLIGFTWFVGSYGLLGNETTSHLARSFQGFFEPLLAWVVLAYPSGRIESRVGRIVVVVWLLDQVAWSVARLLLARPLSWYDCQTCRETVDAFVANAALLERIGPASLALTVVFAALVVAVTVGRVVSARPAARRRLGPAALAGVAMAISVGSTGAIRIGLNASLFDDGRVAAATYVLDMLVAVAVLVGLLQDRLARDAVAELVIHLDGAPGGDPRRTRDALARALGDPTLELFVPTGDGYRDVSGGETRLPPLDRSRAMTRLGGARGGGEVGVLVHDIGLLDDPGLVSAVGAALRLEADNQRLAREVELQLAEVRASRARIVAAGDRERRRVERDLHDGAQQRLISLSMELGRLRGAAERAGDGVMAGELSALGHDLEATIRELRELARGILPGILTDAGLPAAIESLALRASFPVATDIRIADRLPAATEATAYFVIAEALTNAARHAEASAARVAVRMSDGHLLIEVSDDGVGGADPTHGSGLVGLTDRLGAIGGRLTVETLPTGGTRIGATIPLPA